MFTPFFMPRVKDPSRHTPIQNLRKSSPGMTSETFSPRVFTLMANNKRQFQVGGFTFDICGFQILALLLTSSSALNILTLLIVVWFIVTLITKNEKFYKTYTYLCLRPLRIENTIKKTSRGHNVRLLSFISSNNSS